MDRPYILKTLRKHKGPTLPQHSGLAATGNDEDAVASIGKAKESVGEIATSSIAEVAVASVFEGVSNIDRKFFNQKRRKDNGATVLDGTV